MDNKEIKKSAEYQLRNVLLLHGVHLNGDTLAIIPHTDHTSLSISTERAMVTQSLSLHDALTDQWLS